MTEKKQEYSIKDFIGVFNNFISNEICNELIKYFDNKEKFKETYNRIQSENMGQSQKKDGAINVNHNNFETLFRSHSPHMFSVMMNQIVKIYCKETDILTFLNIDDLHWNTFKIQKTNPSEGYHIWHVENCPKILEMTPRVLTFTLYLNDIEEGGETEFLFQKQRCSAKKGRVCIFPSYFPYVHRGNPPLKGTKYIATGWFYCQTD